MLSKKNFVLLGAMSVIFAACVIGYKQFFSQPYLTVVGVVNMADGIGRQSVELIEALRDKVSVGFVATAKPCYKSVSTPVKRIIKNHYRPMGRVVVFEECIWTPEKAHYQLLKTPKQGTQIRLAYTMFESSEIPSEWVSILNEYFDAAVVPDHFLVRVYQDCGVEIPIFVLPLGLNLEPFLKEEVKRKPHYPIVFGNFAACLNRKNQKLLVEAFHEAFGDTDKVVLKINSRYSQEQTAEEIKQLIEEKQMKNVVFTQRSLNSQEYLEAFKTLDCLVSISKGEGFSTQPREAMALGIPVIVSDNSAQKTICRSGLTKIVKASLKEPAMRSWGVILKEPVQYGYEYNCTKEDVVEALLDMYDNYDFYLAKSEQLKNWARKYDYSQLKPLYLSLVKPQKIVLSTKNKITEEALYTNSKKLYEKYQRLLKKDKG
jgi:glycosyltransferase involved in cell wall biosynthesis